MRMLLFPLKKQKYDDITDSDFVLLNAIRIVGT